MTDQTANRVVPDLKSCPCCNGDAESDTNQSYRRIDKEMLGRAVAIYCRECGLQLSLCCADFPDWTPSEVLNLVTEQWNKRAAPSERDTIERCAKVADEATYQGGRAGGVARMIAEQIRALSQCAQGDGGTVEYDHWLIYYDDADRTPEIYTNEAAALHRYKQISVSWNAYLFRMVDANSRDFRERHAKPAQGDESASVQMPESANLGKCREHDSASVAAPCKNTPSAQIADKAQGDAEPVAVHSDDLAVDSFAKKMKAKLAEKREEGRGGWDDPKECSPADLEQMLHDHYYKGDVIDIANFCMMIKERGAPRNWRLTIPNHIARSQVCLDIHEALGVKWGEDVYARINELKAHPTPAQADSEYVMRLEKLNEQLTAELKELDPDPVVCGCHEANCEHTPIAKLPRQALVDHYKRMLKLAREERTTQADAEPVAWYRSGETDIKGWVGTGVVAFGANGRPGSDWQPLYTHPTPDALRSALEDVLALVEALENYPRADLFGTVGRAKINAARDLLKGKS